MRARYPWPKATGSIGMITDRDIAVRAVAEGKDPARTLVKDVMSAEVRYCFDDDDVGDVADNMGEQQVRRLPVVNREKRLVGIISLADIAREREPKRQAKHCKALPARVGSTRSSGRLSRSSQAGREQRAVGDEAEWVAEGVGAVEAALTPRLRFDGPQNVRAGLARALERGLEVIHREVHVIRIGLGVPRVAIGARVEAGEDGAAAAEVVAAVGYRRARGLEQRGVELFCADDIAHRQDDAEESDHDGLTSGGHSSEAR